MAPSADARIDHGIEHAASSARWLRRTLEEILSQIRVLLDVDGCAFQTIDFERRQISLAASWFETPDMRAAMAPVFERPYDPERGGVTEAAVERGETVLIDDMERWKGAGALRARLRTQLAPEAAVRRGSGTGRRRSSPARSGPRAAGRSASSGCRRARRDRRSAVSTCA